jgi:hypothetical protein
MTSPVGIGEMARLVVAGASGTYRPTTIPVEPASASVQAPALEARIGGCGNPPAALVVVEVATS